MSPHKSTDALVWIELCPVNIPFPRSNAKSTHYCWWSGGRNEWDVTEAMIALRDGFYVYDQLAPIKEYTAFTLRIDGTLVEGSVTNEFGGVKKYLRSVRDQEVMDGKRPEFINQPLRLRFQVLKRDGFRCHYCGSTPAETELQIDHVTPRAKGGLSVLDNLVTSCKACNLGKGDVLLTLQTVPA
jgi:hypothetical protein